MGIKVVGDQGPAEEKKGSNIKRYAAIALLVSGVAAGVYHTMIKKPDYEDNGKTSDGADMYTRNNRDYVITDNIDDKAYNDTAYEVIKEAEKEVEKETQTEDKVEKYVNTATDGRYEEGSKVYIPEYDIQGIISTGAIENGEILGRTFILRNEEGKQVMGYSKMNTKDHGTLTLITYPQKAGERHSAIMKKNGEDTGVCLMYDSRFDFDNYKRVVFEPERSASGIIAATLC